MNRPFSRAVTMSASDLMATQTSSSTRGSHCTVVQLDETFLQIQRSRDPLQRQPELHHRKGDFGLNAHDNHFRPPQPDHMGQRTESLGRKRVHHIEGGKIDDHSAGAVLPYLSGQLIPELQEVFVIQGRLNDRYEILTLFEDRDPHSVPPPCSCS